MCKNQSSLMLEENWLCRGYALFGICVIKNIACTCSSLYSSSYMIQKQPLEVFRKNVLKIFVKFTGKRLCQSLFLKKSCKPKPKTSLKKRLWHRCLFVKFAIFLEHFFYRTPSNNCLLK